jgi:peptidoglycan/xylan/chitin deacetylase (PgdA/CDA1 family)
MSMIAKRELLARSLIATGCEWFLHQFGAWRGLLVLNYHRIGNPAGTPWDHDLWSADAEEFDWQVRYLKRHFDLIGVDELEHARQDRRGRYVMISFDDGYRDNYELAFPALKSHGVPATFFLATQFLDQPYVSWWDEIAWMIRTTDREFLDGPGWLADPILINHLQPQTTIRVLLKIYKKLSNDQTTEFLTWLGEETGRGRCPAKLASDMWMTWDMAREMQAAGMSFGAHTVSHPILPRLPADAQRREIIDSHQRIEQELGQPIRAFSYPVGGAGSCSPETVDCLRDTGIEWGFRFGIGYHKDSFRDPLQIPRLAVDQTDGRAIFRAITMLPQVFD